MLGVFITTWAKENLKTKSEKANYINQLLMSLCIHNCHYYYYRSIVETWSWFTYNNNTTCEIISLLSMAKNHFLKITLSKPCEKGASFHQRMAKQHRYLYYTQSHTKQLTAIFKVDFSAKTFPTHVHVVGAI